MDGCAGQTRPAKLSQHDARHYGEARCRCDRRLRREERAVRAAGQLDRPDPGRAQVSPGEHPRHGEVRGAAEAVRDGARQSDPAADQGGAVRQCRHARRKVLRLSVARADLRADGQQEPAGRLRGEVCGPGLCRLPLLLVRKGRPSGPAGGEMSARRHRRTHGEVVGASHSLLGAGGTDGRAAIRRQHASYPGGPRVRAGHSEKIDALAGQAGPARQRRAGGQGGGLREDYRQRVDAHRLPGGPTGASADNVRLRHQEATGACPEGADYAVHLERQCHRQRIRLQEGSRLARLCRARGGQVVAETADLGARRSPESVGQRGEESRAAGAGDAVFQADGPHVLYG